ncbi:MAG: IS200/IS605 family transposase [Acidobacteria bacterium]|nr:IS200/IS605 family transposase [Acidobacteriota bacterium]
MPHTYSQISIQIVFAVEGRQNLISPKWREGLHKYMTGIITKRGQKLIAIFCMPDHTHLLVGIKPSIAISNLVRDIKAGSSNFINEKRWIRGHFNWQEGFGAFSYSRSQIAAVSDYILEQETRHKNRSFKREYLGLLEKFEVEYYEKYLFDWIE